MSQIICTPWLSADKSGAIEDLTAHTFKALLNKLAIQGFSAENVVKVRAKLSNLKEDFSLYNGAYASIFTTKPLPSRATIGYSLPTNCALSIQCLATKNKPVSIHSENAPAAIGPYSQAIGAGNSLFISGQIPIDLILKKLILIYFWTRSIQYFLTSAAF